MKLFRTASPVYIAVVLLFGCSLLCSSASAYELTTSDRLAILYSSQLQFSVEGDPILTIGLVEGVEEITFSPDAPIDVMPLGEGGPVIQLPARDSYTVSIEDGQAGVYRYWVIVGRGLPSDRRHMAEQRDVWRDRGYEPRTFELGSFFAIEGTTFDNRQIILAIGGSGARQEAQTLADHLEREYGLLAELHVELEAYPSGLLTLTADDIEVVMSHHDLLVVRPHGEGTMEVSADAFTTERDPSARRYTGALIFTVDRDGGLSLVNELPAERLLEGILPAEIYASAPADALRAQAVAARSELLANIGVRYLADPYMTCATTRCQVYHGINSEDGRTSSAVADTRGTVLMSGSHVAHTVYSASCGGSHGDYASTWGGEPIAHLTYHLDGFHLPAEFSNGIDDSNLEAFLDADLNTFDNIDNFGGSRTFRWTVDLSGAALSEAVNQRYAVGDVTAMSVLERDDSGRVVRLLIEGTDGSVIVERELPIRRALGGLRSALFLFDVTTRDGQVSDIEIRGGGFGHGVGLCQVGAIGAAQRDLDYLEILAHYYPNTEALVLWD